MTLKFQSFALPLLIALLASSQPAFADCHSSIKLEGTANIDCCTPAEACIPAAQALYGYLDAIKDDPAAFTIALQASPWHLYDGELRILTVRGAGGQRQVPREETLREARRLPGQRHGWILVGGKERHNSHDSASFHHEAKVCLCSPSW